jgi:hypothetical protein
MNEPSHELPSTTPDDLRWQLSYDRSSVDRFLAEVEGERARLQADIRAARERVGASERAAAAREREGLAAIGALALAAREELTRIEAEHRAIITTIQDAAAIEAARVLAAAHREAEAMCASTASLAGLVVAAEPESSAAAAGVRGHADAG